MRILLTNDSLNFYGGSELFTYTMAKELSKRCQTSIFSYEYGKIAERIKPFAKLTKRIGDYDIAFVNHNSCLPIVDCKKIFTSHGIIPELEQPIEGADAYVAVSEEVLRNFWRKGFSGVVIRNGIDCERFSPKSKIRKKPKTVLYLSNRTGKSYEIVKKACEKLNLNLLTVGLPFGNAMWEVEKIMNSADIVISLGRGIYEAMACGRAAIVYGQFGGDGIITPELYLESRKNNCSGRRFRKDWSVEDLIGEIKKYSPEMGEMNRNIAFENHDIKKTLKQYLKIYDALNSA